MAKIISILVECNGETHEILMDGLEDYIIDDTGNSAFAFYLKSYLQDNDCPICGDVCVGPVGQ